MSEWISVAHKIKQVNEACEDFFMRGVIERCIIGPMLLDRLEADLYEPDRVTLGGAWVQDDAADADER